MERKDPRQIQAELAMPFAPEDLEWRLQKANAEKGWGIAVPYVTNRAIMTRLDDVVGPENWYNEFKPWHSDGKKQSQLCGISIRFGEQFITKWDGAEDSDIESIKGGLSDSMKRAAVQWGIGRVLYNMDAVFVDVEQKGKTTYIKKDQQDKLDYQYLKMLGKLGLTPAKPGGLRPQTEPEAAEDGQKPEPRQEKPAEILKPDNITYTIRNMRVNKGIKTTNTQLVLESSKGERVDAFARGEHPKLVVGTILTDVKLERKGTDTVIYFMLEQYKVADAQPKAA